MEYEIYSDEIYSDEIWSEKIAQRPLTVLCGINGIGKSAAISAIKPRFVHDKPEAGLHPSLIVPKIEELCKLVSATKSGMDSATKSNVTCIETHNENVINGIQLAVLKGFIDNTDISINFLYPESSFVEVADICIRPERECINLSYSERRFVEVIHIYITPKGELTFYPKGFMDQMQVTYVDILRLRKIIKC